MTNKHFRMIWGIMIHPVKLIIMRMRHAETQSTLMYDAKRRKYNSDHERMHYFANFCNVAYTSSPLYNHLGEL